MSEVLTNFILTQVVSESHSAVTAVKVIMRLLRDPRKDELIRSKCIQVTRKYGTRHRNSHHFHIPVCWDDGLLGFSFRLRLSSFVGFTE